MYICNAANRNKNRQNTISSVDKNNKHYNQNIYFVTGVYQNNIVAKLMNDELMKLFIKITQI